MADDLRDAFGDDIFVDPEDEFGDEVEGEGQNKMFLIGVAVLGGLLLIAIIAFVLWAAVLNPRMQADRDVQNQAIIATNQAVQIALDATATADAMPTATPLPEEPENTPTPTATATPVIAPTATPTSTPEPLEPPENGNGEQPPDDDEGPETAEPRRTATPTRTPTATRTPSAPATGTDDNGELAETGMGEVILVVAGLLLIGVLFVARRLRTA